MISPHPSPTPTDTETPTPTPTDTPATTPTITPTSTPPPPSGPVTIIYTYDPLNRLTAADYSDDTWFHYTYDAIGNTLKGAGRLTQVTDLNTTTYTYDIANRMTNVNGITYTWDDNPLTRAGGNLINDGVNAYAYTIEDRLSSITNGGGTSNYYYNGLGDPLKGARRLFQVVDGVTTHYMLDINAGVPPARSYAGGLTQVLTDGTNTYLYGLSHLVIK